jgi:hypothetical protein
MPYLVLGILGIASGVFLYRRGKHVGSKEIQFGSLGLIFGGVFLVILSMILFFSKEI